MYVKLAAEASDSSTQLACIHSWTHSNRRVAGSRHFWRARTGREDEPAAATLAVVAATEVVVAAPRYSSRRDCKSEQAGGELWLGGVKRAGQVR
jgi:hypothetical protein